MFNFTGVLLSVVNGAVVDKPTSDFTGHSVSINATTSNDIIDIIFLLLIVFIAGMFTHYAYVKIKEYIKKNIKEEEEEEEKDNNKRE